MKQLIYALLLYILLFGCKKDPTPLPAIQEIVGRWRLDAMEKTVNGQKVWEKVDDTSPAYLAFRFDGVVLDSKGLPWCCSPDTLVVNVTPFKIKPQAEVPSNPQCALIDCLSCSSWYLEQKENELTLTSKCESLNYRHRYLRE